MKVSGLTIAGLWISGRRAQSLWRSWQSVEHFALKRTYVKVGLAQPSEEGGHYTPAVPLHAVVNLL